MKVLVTGATGQLGHDCVIELERRDIEVRGVSSKDFSITDYDATRRAIEEYAPDVIVHCAAYTHVDKAEDDQDLCWAVNADATENIARICADHDITLIYISTDYVFPGTGSASFEVGSDVGPTNAYGRSKLAGEDDVMRWLEKFFIVRTSWVFGISGENFIRKMLRLSEEHDTISVVDDQVGSPTYTVDLAVLIADMVDSDSYGVYHATNEGFCSWAELAREVFRQAGKETVVKPVLSADYPTKAPRPRNSRLSKDSLDLAGFRRLPRWKDAVGRYLIELSAQENI